MKEEVLLFLREVVRTRKQNCNRREEEVNGAGGEAWSHHCRICSKLASAHTRRQMRRHEKKERDKRVVYVHSCQSREKGKGSNNLFPTRQTNQRRAGAGREMNRLWRAVKRRPLWVMGSMRESKSRGDMEENKYVCVLMYNECACLYAGMHQFGCSEIERLKDGLPLLSV